MGEPMNSEDIRRLRGLKSLFHDSVKRGANFVEKHHRRATEKPFQVLESISPIAVPTKVVRTVHDGVLSLTYGGIRSVNQAAEVVDDWIVDRLDPAGGAGE